MCYLTSVISTSFSIKQYVEPLYISEVRCTDTTRSTSFTSTAVMARKTTYNESTILYDITSMSVQMRKMVYNCATTQASSGRKVIASAGVDRVQEAFALEADRFADIFVNPNVDLAKGTYTNQTKMIVKYDTEKPMKARLRR
ncbi:hypothetical protein HBI56_225810 [Parastagonospora nodorum]|nr:hypothetical protein HBH56_239430 [Parastagonospora nodorum]KAH4008642.1 hypothetical protein HBI13_234060 [Parastagonospora nodorum]KAH4084912.1 hypothetical protein HBH46_211440 [Parastagonospora nodorum]KAH4112697.1 hypothetical protein HBH47_221840 [Parastagonospora nodorum]KAH4147509.1 hypothetical protein HBH44_225430 [Parastagonospora nodorum]